MVPPFGWRLLAIGTVVAALVVPVAGLLFCPRAESRARADLVETLNSRAEIRAATVSRWADDALRDARLVASYPSAIELLRAADPSLHHGISPDRGAAAFCWNQGIRPGAHRPRRAGRGPSGQPLDLTGLHRLSRRRAGDGGRFAQA